MVSLACILRRRLAHYRGELLVLRKKESVARSLGDLGMSQRIEQEIARNRHSLNALEQALGEWAATNAGEVRRQLEATAEGADS